MADLTTGASVYDKYDPISGGFRVPLADDMDAADTPIGVGLDSSGEVVPGAGQTGVIGVVCLTKDKKAGDIVDVMTSGEIADAAGIAAGTIVTANTTSGVISDGAASATQTPVGFTAEASRLIVRKTVGTFDDDGA